MTRTWFVEVQGKDEIAEIPWEEVAKYGVYNNGIHVAYVKMIKEETKSPRYKSPRKSSRSYELKKQTMKLSFELDKRVIMEYKHKIEHSNRGSWYSILKELERIETQLHTQDVVVAMNESSFSPFPRDLKSIIFSYAQVCDRKKVLKMAYGLMGYDSTDIHQKLWFPEYHNVAKKFCRIVNGTNKRGDESFIPQAVVLHRCFPLHLVKPEIERRKRSEETQIRNDKKRKQVDEFVS